VFFSLAFAGKGVLMAFVFLSLDTIKELDNGRVAEAFTQALARAVRDCEDRPTEEKDREVILGIKLKPIPADEGIPTGVALMCQVRDTVPTRKSRPYSCGIKSGGKLFFSTESPDNVNQLTLGLADD
jgi:hypothetical protein